MNSDFFCYQSHQSSFLVHKTSCARCFYCTLHSSNPRKVECSAGNINFSCHTTVTVGVPPSRFLRYNLYIFFLENSLNILSIFECVIGCEYFLHSILVIMRQIMLRGFIFCWLKLARVIPLPCIFMSIAEFSPRIFCRPHHHFLYSLI